MVSGSIQGRGMTTKVVTEGDGFFSFYQALELEDDFAYDDNLWRWEDEDYEEGLFPSALIDCAVPVCWLKVYSCDQVSTAVGLQSLTRKLIGFKRLTLRELLAIGVPTPHHQLSTLKSQPWCLNPA